MAGVEVLPLVLPARAPPGVRLPVRRPRLHHRREGHSRTRSATSSRASRCWCSMRSGGGRTRPISASPRRSRPPGAGRAPHLPDPPDARDRSRRAGGAAADGVMPGVRRAHRGGCVIKLAYGRMLQDGLDGKHGLAARPAGGARRAASRAVQAEVRRRRARGRVRVLRAGGPGRPRSGRSPTFAEGLGQAHDHVLVLGIGGSALGTKALLNALRRPGVERVGRRGPGVLSPAHRPGERRPDDGRAPRSRGSTRGGCWST